MTFIICRCPVSNYYFAHTVSCFYFGGLSLQVQHHVLLSENCLGTFFLFKYSLLYWHSWDVTTEFSSDSHMSWFCFFQKFRILGTRVETILAFRLHQPQLISVSWAALWAEPCGQRSSPTPEGLEKYQALSNLSGSSLLRIPIFKIELKMGENTYVYVWLRPFAVQLKLSHC